MALGVAVLIGWCFKIEGLIRVAPGLVAMNPVTALLFVFLGVALAMLSYRPVAASALGIFIIVVGLLRLSEVLTGIDIGIDRILFRSRLTSPHAALSCQVAPLTALNFALLGLALSFVRGQSLRLVWAAHALALIATFPSLLVLISYTYNLHSFLSVRWLYPMPLHTAIGFLVAIAGLFVHRPSLGVMSLLTSRSLGGTLVRRFLPAALLVPLIFGWFQIVGQRRGIFNHEFGAALTVALTVVIFSALVWQIGRLQDRVDLRKQHELATHKQIGQDLQANLCQREEATRELVTAKNQAEAANRAKSEFLANMSHEIRTPMNGILGMIELLQHSQLSDQEKHYLALMKTSAKSLLQIIGDILDLSKIEAGKMTLEEESFNMHSALESALTVVAMPAQQKGLKFVCDVDSRLPMNLEGDSLRLNQIIFNLVGNATKFTQTGEIRLAVAVEEETSQHVVLHFAVSDTGPGIPPDKLQSIFEAFTQVDNSATRRFGGTGLGLTICRELVRLMGGRIWVESRVGAGSTFHFTARFKIAAAQPQAAARSDTQFFRRQSRPLKILVAEDNDINQVLITDILSQVGHSVTVAKNGKEAVEAFQREKWDLILMDVQMPQMDGLQATAVIRQTEQFRPQGGHIPIIALTAHAMTGDRERCLAAGMNDYLTKPIHTPELLRTLNRFAPAVSTTAPAPTPQLKEENGHALPSTFDLQVLLSRCRGDKQLAKKIAQLYTEQTPALLEEIRAALCGADANRLERAAHTLKGSLGQIGANAASDVAYRLEEAGRAGRLADTAEALRHLEEQTGAVNRVMYKLVENTI